MGRMKATPPHRSVLVRLVGRLLLALFATAGSLLVAEGVARLSTPAIAFVPMSAQIADDEFGYALQPGYRSDDGEGRYGCSVRISPQGLRDDPYDERQPGDLRIMVLGDSFCFPDGVEREQVFPELLEGRLSNEYGDRRVSVLNAGVPSYATFQEDRMLRRHGAAFRPDAVVLQYCPNDLPSNLKHTPEGVQFLAEQVRGRRRLYSGIGVLAVHSQLVRWMGQIVARQGVRREISHRVDLERLQPGSSNEAYLQALCLQFVDSIRAQCEELHAALVVLVVRFPRRAGLPLPHGEGEDHFLVRHCRKFGVPCTTISGAAERVGHTWSDCIDGHFTPRGHAIAANALHDLLAEASVLPERKPR
jgi:hypothetical protein